MSASRIYQPRSLADILNVSQTNPGTLIVIDCKAAWCGPCKAIHPHIINLANSMTHVIFMEVDVDDEDHLATCSAFEITAMPTFIYMKNGQLLTKTTGANLQAITATVNQYA